LSRPPTRPSWSKDSRASAKQCAPPLAEAPPPVHACFCFLNPVKQAGGSGLPVLRTLKIDDSPLFYPRRLAKRLNAPGALSAESRREVADLLASAFPPA
jgi:hypothetical protein